MSHKPWRVVITSHIKHAIAKKPSCTTGTSGVPLLTSRRKRVITGTYLFRASKRRRSCPAAEPACSKDNESCIETMGPELSRSYVYAIFLIAESRCPAGNQASAIRDPNECLHTGGAETVDDSCRATGRVGLDLPCVILVTSSSCSDPVDVSSTIYPVAFCCRRRCRSLRRKSFITSERILRRSALVAPKAASSPPPNSAGETCTNSRFCIARVVDLWRFRQRLKRDTKTDVEDIVTHHQDEHTHPGQDNPVNTGFYTSTTHNHDRVVRRLLQLEKEATR